MSRLKFEYLFAFALLAILSAALFLFRNDSDMVNLIIGSLVGGFGSITAYFFTKHTPGKDE